MVAARRCGRHWRGVGWWVLADIDPICTVTPIVVAIVTKDVMAQGFDVLMGAAPEDIDYEAMEEALNDIRTSVELRSWSLLSSSLIHFAPTPQLEPYYFEPTPQLQPYLLCTDSSESPYILDKAFSTSLLVVYMLA